MTLNGIDTASYQAGIGKVASDFRIIKATEGTGYTNPDLQGQINTAPALKGFYHFASNVDWKAEADHFISKVKPYLGRAVLVLDYEPSYPNVAWAKAWLDYVYKQTGVRPLIYLGLYVENTYDWSSVANANYGLWISQYNNYNVVSGFHTRSIYGSVKHWKSTAIFQYTSTGRLGGWGGNLDFNVFYGDKNAWARYAAKNGKVVSAPSPKPAAKPASKPKANASSFVDDLGVRWYYQKGTFTSNSTINLRYGARTTSMVIATLPAGSTVKYDAYCFSGGYVWIRQPRGNSFGYMSTGTASGSKRTSYWGRFK